MIKLADCYIIKSQDFRHKVCSNCPSYKYIQSEYIETCYVFHEDK